MKTKMFKGGLVLAATVMTGMISFSGNAGADPVDDKLVIDGEMEIVTRAKAAEGMPYGEVISGWHFREPETRALQADSFQNPAMLAVEEGAALWEKVEGTAGKSCSSCHGDAAESMKDVGANYPKWDATNNKPINVELQINKCRTEQMGAEAYAFDKGGQIPMTAFIKNKAYGKPISIDLSQGEMQKWWDQGKDVY